MGRYAPDSTVFNIGVWCCIVHHFEMVNNLEGCTLVITRYLLVIHDYECMYKYYSTICGISDHVTLPVDAGPKLLLSFWVSIVHRVTQLGKFTARQQFDACTPPPLSCIEDQFVGGFSNLICPGSGALYCIRYLESLYNTCLVQGVVLHCTGYLEGLYHKFIHALRKGPFVPCPGGSMLCKKFHRLVIFGMNVEEEKLDMKSSS